MSVEGWHFTLEKENIDFKLCRIEDKTTIKGGKTQLNLHDGRNFITDGEYKTGDVLVLNVPEQEIKDHIKFESGTIGLITGGKHIGEKGTVKEINITHGSMPNTVLMETNQKLSKHCRNTFSYWVRQTSYNTAWR